MFGAIEAGGTKFVCGVGTGPHDLKTIQLPTTTPDETIEKAISFFREAGGSALEAVGIGSFGPLDLRRESPLWGHITSTPKVQWQNYDFAGAIGKALTLPVGFDTDVNAAALGEACWGAAKGLDNFLYLTVGTGIGGGAVVNGSVLHGMLHPEMGHIRIPHDTVRDPYPGGCPFHRDCLEGLASGPAIHERWGKPAQELPGDHPAWALEAGYIALALANWVCTLSPQKIVIGGGVMQQPQLFAMVRKNLSSVLNGYVRTREILSGLDSFVVPPALRGQSGVLGALILAEQAKR